jgi:hypothetical protein
MSIDLLRGSRISPNGTKKAGRKSIHGKLGEGAPVFAKTTQLPMKLASTAATDTYALREREARVTHMISSAAARGRSSTNQGNIVGLEALRISNW